MSRACDAIGCTCQTATGRFMCPRHWRCVPLDIQRTINRQFRLAKTRHALMHDPIYVEACATAVEQLAQADGLPTENSYRRLLAVLNRRGEEAATAPAAFGGRRATSVFIDEAVEQTEADRQRFLRRSDT